MGLFKSLKMLKESRKKDKNAIIIEADFSAGTGNMSEETMLDISADSLTAAFETEGFIAKKGLSSTKLQKPIYVKGVITKGHTPYNINVFIQRAGSQTKLVYTIPCGGQKLVDYVISIINKAK